MASSGLVNELSHLCAEIRSEKIASRNKAADRLDNILTTSKVELLTYYQRQINNMNVSWSELFNSAVDGTLRHAAKVEESLDSKSLQTLRNKNYVYIAIINKLVDYSLEDNNNFLSKTTILSAFFNGFSTLSAVKHFGALFLLLLENGIYKSPVNTSELKVNEFSRILSFLFEVNISNDENLKVGIMRGITKTIELAEKYVQVNADLIDYFPEIESFVAIAFDERRKAEVIKLYYLFISQLAIDYHISVCHYIQKLLSAVCGYYNFRMKSEVKEVFFRSIYISLTTIYPKITKGEFKTINVVLHDNWNKTLRKIMCIIETEIKERKVQLCRSGTMQDERCLNVFLKMAAPIVYLIYWNLDLKVDEEVNECRRKVPKSADKMEIILRLVQPEETLFNEIWLGVFAELITTQEYVVNVTNFEPMLMTVHRVLCIFNTSKSLKYIKMCVHSLLKHERKLIESKMIQANYFSNKWAKVTEFVIGDCSATSAIIIEKQLLLQTLVANGKLTSNDCMTLINSLLSNKTMRRTECIATIYQILLHAESCCIDKSSQLISRIINWLHETNSKIDAKSMLLNIEPIDINLIINTSAIAVINFLDESKLIGEEILPDDVPPDNHEMRLIWYKYCLKYICIEEYGKEIKRLTTNKSPTDELVESKSCLFQSNYELLMRLLNFETSKESSPADISLDLSRLNAMALLMRKFFEYAILSEANYVQCPLVKRISFFLSHLEFQLKSTNPRHCDKSDLLDILQRIESTFTTFVSNNILLGYLEKQNLSELIEFIGKTLQFCASQTVCNDFEKDLSQLIKTCQRILASLCSCASHYKENFAHLIRYKFSIQNDVTNIISLIMIFCSQKVAYREVADWFIDKLKIICKLYHTNIEISQQIVDVLPGIFRYVKTFVEPLQNMLVILSSFLKKAYKKSYSIKLTAKLIGSVQFIAKSDVNYCELEDFTNIYLSTAKFLSSTSIEVQFATVKTVCALLDSKWFAGDKNSKCISVHFEFCKKLYSQLDWKSLSTSSDDLKTNSNAITIQLLTSIFAFSAFHQGSAFQELVYFCAVRRLTESDFLQFSQIAAFFNCDLCNLTKPYVTQLINNWTEKKYPITKFPYFLCSENKKGFISSYIGQISCCLLINASPAEIEDLERKNFGSTQELIQIAMPNCCAFTLPSLSDGTVSDLLNYQNNVKLLFINLERLGIELWPKESKINYKTIIFLIEMLTDMRHFEKVFGFQMCVIESKWPAINIEAFRKCLEFYIEKCYNYNRKRIGDNCFWLIIKKDPIVLIKTFAEFKLRSVKSTFIIDQLRYFHAYCVLAEIVIDSMEDESSESSKYTQKFFVRDIIFFNLNIITDQKSKYEMLYSSLNFLRYIIEKQAFAVDYCEDVLKTFMNDIIRSLVVMIENTVYEEIRNLSKDLLYYFMSNMSNKLSDAIQLLDEFPQSKQFEELRIIQKTASTTVKKDLEADIKIFLLANNRGTEALNAIKLSVSKQKISMQELCQQRNIKNSLYDLLKRLIEIVRNGNRQYADKAAKCLGEIGAVKIEGFAYYFQTDETFYDMETKCKDEMKFVAESLYIVLGKLLLQYNSSTHTIICEVCEQLVNSKFGQTIIESFPYFKVFLVEGRSNVLNGYKSIKPTDFVSILRSTENLPYQQWIKTFSSKIFECCNWKIFETLSMLDNYFAESSIVPIFKILLANEQQHVQNIILLLDYFFTECFLVLTGSETSACKTLYKEKKAILHFLNICECIRIHSNWKIPINLLYVAKASNFCQAYFMAILYLEMWALNEKFDSEKLKSDIIENVIFQDVATKAYQSIGCSEATAGFLNPLSSRLEFLNLEGNWTDVILDADATNLTEHSLYTSSLKRNGLFLISASNMRNKQVDYESCWRLCQWETIVDGHSKLNSLNDMEYEFSKHHFNALKFIYNREENNSLAAIASARQCIISILKEISIECLQSIYKYLTWMHLLQQAEDFCVVQFALASSVEEIFRKWELESDLSYGNFACKEQILSHQMALFKTAGIRANRKIEEFYKKQNVIGNCLLKCIKECKHNGAVNLAIRNIALLKNLEVSGQIKVSALLEDAQICQKTGKFSIAKAILQHVISNKEFVYCLQRIKAHRMYGEHLLESNSETFEVVLKKYFEGSINLLNNYGMHKEQILKANPNAFDANSFEEFEKKHRKQAFKTIAKYADREYTQLNSYSKSEAFQKKCEIMKKNKEEAHSLSKEHGKDRDKAISINVLIKNCGIDDKEIKAVELKRSENLCIAVENYMKFCKLDDAITSPVIYRIISLWFANKYNDALNTKIEDHIDEVPSYKFVCALNQMTARLNFKNNAFLEIIKKILVRCVEDHPQQTLPQLFALVFGFFDSNKGNNSNDRVTISKDIINAAKKKSNINSINQMENMFSALIDFANKDAGKSTLLNLSDKLKRLKNQDSVQCLTIDLPVSVNKEYTLATIIKWEEKVSLVGGINAPKKLMCLCSDGYLRPQLLKGKDDLRQDAVMQQVLSMVNDLLKRNPETNEQKLSLRTYRVVPLSMRSGILEWCQNTVPIGLYLCGNKTMEGAHKKYRPDDYSVGKCRALSMEFLKHDFDKRLEIYLHICGKVKPVFHYFFFEKFLVPGIWFESRLAYTKSVATTSIVGFILGLGDRHLQNILIDEITGEVIHIDFGIAFEQGRIMPTPETVPFRLTRDIVGPMGVCEVDGIFKKSCETTMSILSKNQVVITTILEVLLYDPLYIWKIASQNMVENTCDEKNLTAERALLRVKEKLEGKVIGKLGASGVDVQVQRLINDAINVRNLCRLYPGWDPYL